MGTSEVLALGQQGIEQVSYGYFFYFITLSDVRHIFLLQRLSLRHLLYMVNVSIYPHYPTEAKRVILAPNATNRRQGLLYGIVHRAALFYTAWGS